MVLFFHFSPQVGSQQKGSVGGTRASAAGALSSVTDLSTLKIRPQFEFKLEKAELHAMGINESLVDIFIIYSFLVEKVTFFWYFP